MEGRFQAKCDLRQEHATPENLAKGIGEDALELSPRVIDHAGVADVLEAVGAHFVLHGEIEDAIEPRFDDDSALLLPGFCQPLEQRWRECFVGEQAAVAMSGGGEGGFANNVWVA